MPSSFVKGLQQLKLQLPEEVIGRELEFLDELLRWNHRVNLTSITDRHEAIEKHLLDSLMLLSHLGGAKSVLDVGSGGGLPGIPLAIAASHLRVVSVDSVGKKINFQKHIKRLLNLKNLTVVQSRIEELERLELKEKKYDLVVSRAFSSLEMFVECAVPFLAPDGQLVAMKGPEGWDELNSAGVYLKKYSLEEPLTSSYFLPYSGAERLFIVLKNLEKKNSSNK